jgi:hypothetical protein
MYSKSDSKRYTTVRRGERETIRRSMVWDRDLDEWEEDEEDESTGEEGLDEGE